MKIEMTNNMWKILKGETTLPEALRYFETPQQEINAMMNGINSSDYYVVSNVLKRKAYDYLLSVNEISADKVFNMGSNSIEEVPRHGDMGFRGKSCYVYTNNEWTVL